MSGGGRRELPAVTMVTTALLFVAVLPSDGGGTISFTRFLYKKHRTILMHQSALKLAINLSSTCLSDGERCD